jgi:hypothetical protein
MNETVPQTRLRPATRPKRFRIVALIVTAAAAGVIAWLALRDTGGSSSSKTEALSATAVSVQQIQTLAASVGHPIFWIGPKTGDTLELSRNSNGSIFVRYLPPGAKVGSSTPYLTVATYPFAGAFAAIQTVAKQSGSTPMKLAQGGLGVVSATYPQSVHVAYPDVDYQVEVYDPTAGNATSIVEGGKLAALGGLDTGSAAAARPKAVSVADLKSFAQSLGHAVYWVGPKKSTTYELTETTSGQVYIRYLPIGVAAGAAPPYLTVATYPFSAAFAAMQALAKQPGQTSIAIAHGGIAVFDTQYPKSIHLAFPGSDYEVEVFDPVPAVVRQIVASGKVSSIG